MSKKNCGMCVKGGGADANLKMSIYPILKTYHPAAFSLVISIVSHSAGSRDSGERAFNAHRQSMRRDKFGFPWQHWSMYWLKS